MKSPTNRLRRPLQALVLSAILPISPQTVVANTITHNGDWIIGAGGAVSASPGDLYRAGKGFYNSSTQNTVWDTTPATLEFFTPATNTTGNHEFTYAGLNLGSSYSGFTNNFAWNSVVVQSGNQLINTNSSALYTRGLTLGGGISQISTFSGNMAIYYDIANPGNAYLAGGFYSFGSGTGFVAPVGNLPVNVSYWAVNANSTWVAASNWSKNIVPNFVEAEVDFGPGVSGTGAAFTGPRSVTLDGVRTVGKMVFSDTNSFTVASGTGGSLVLNNSSLVSQIKVTTGTHAISAPVTLTAKGVELDIASGSMLAISNMVSGTSGLNKSNSGRLDLTGSNTYTGPTNVNLGTLNVNNSLASKNLNVASGAILNLNVAAATGTSTALSVSGVANFFGPDASIHKVGALNILSSGTVVLTAHGNSSGASNVKVLDISSLTISGTASFAGGEVKEAGACPALGTGDAYDEQLAGGGFAVAEPVPEPGTAALLAAGAIAGAILRYRNRKSVTR